jgi:hypothetical protein
MASGIFGVLISSRLKESDGGFLGFTGGMSTFAFARLWLAPKR